MLASSHALEEMLEMRIRTMTKDDISAGMRLKELAGWNQTEADWKRFLEASPAGCFVSEVNGKVRGTAATISFEARFAWVGMVLVDPDFRGRGIGTDLLKTAIEYLDGRRIATIKLDATPQGKLIYEKLGFVAEYEIERWTVRRPQTALTTLTGPDRATPPAQEMEEILRMDREVFGADRSSLLRSLYDDAPDFAMATHDVRGLQGYAFGRRGSFADHLGPWMATEEKLARSVLEEFLKRSSRDRVVVDCMKSSHVAGKLLREFGFEYARPLTRMVRGANQHPGRPEKLYAIMGPEFG
jgi:GNAT superfamily N-acetyltransferase